MTHWGARIAAIRKSSGLSRPDFGMRVGEPHYLIQRWELEGREPLVHTALHMARRLGLRVDDLTGPWSRRWSGGFTDSPRVYRHQTMWRANIIDLAEAAGDRSRLARELMSTKAMMQSWITRRSVPTLDCATDVSVMTGVPLHDLLTRQIDGGAALAHARIMRQIRARRRPPTSDARPTGCGDPGPLP